MRAVRACGGVRGCTPEEAEALADDSELDAAALDVLGRLERHRAAGDRLSRIVQGLRQVDVEAVGLDLRLGEHRSECCVCCGAFRNAARGDLSAHFQKKFAIVGQGIVIAMIGRAARLWPLLARSPADRKSICQCLAPW